ncbi:MAG: CHAT domain-containing protein [Cyanobacteria bacterium P01_H01_bin.21]
MARKRDLFFHSILAFLGRCQLLAQGQWLRWLTRGRRWAVYGGLTAIALVCATTISGFASVGQVAPRADSFQAAVPEATVAQLSDQGSPKQSEAQRLYQLAKDQYAVGQFDAAADNFERVAALFTQLDSSEQAAESQINQAKALQGLGLYNQAIVILQQALQPPDQSMLLLEGVEPQQDGENACLPLEQRLEALSPSAATIFALRSLGDALQVVGDLDYSQCLLKHSLKLAETVTPNEMGPIYLSLGNANRTQAIANLRLDNMDTEAAVEQLQKNLSPIQSELQLHRTTAAHAFREQTDIALGYYDDSANTSSPLTQVQAYVNKISLYLERQEWSETVATIPQLDPLLESLPPSRAAINAHVNLAHSLMRLDDEQAARLLDNPLLQAAQLLATAQNQASQLGAPQTESYVLGSLGELYEHTQQWSEAKAVTQQALEKVNAVSVTNLPLTINDVDLAYRWYRQLGKILVAQNETAEAIKAYEAAVELLQERLRLDVASGNLNSQFSFSEEAQEPVHRELMDLLLQPEDPSDENLQQVRELSSSLIEAELTSFLQEPCEIATPGEIDDIVTNQGQDVAIIYPIVLPDRLEVIVKLPGAQPLFHDRTIIREEQLLAEIKDLQLALEEDYTFEAVDTLSQKLYTQIFKPEFENKLRDQGINTLIFTLDRKLQTIPMAALYDGDEYLIEKFAISEFLGLRVEGGGEPLQPKDLKIMTAGLSSLPRLLPDRVKHNFVPLAYVPQELDEINAFEENNGITVATLQDDEFTLANFNARLNEDEFPVVHLATHGQFSIDPESTFLLTSGESDEALIEVNELAALFRIRGFIRPDAIELLVLNACETASGDDLATLGIAGTAVRAGARSAIASLWTLNDELSVRFTKTLYENLQQSGLSKAEALRNAQLALLNEEQYRHPRYWSPYILAGNWLPLTISR